MVVTEKPNGKKKSTYKRKIASEEIVKDDMEENLNNILVSHVKKKQNKIRGEKIPTSIPINTMDKVSFHSEESVLKCEYVFIKGYPPKGSCLNRL